MVNFFTSAPDALFVILHQQNLSQVYKHICTPDDRSLQKIVLSHFILSQTVIS